MDQFAAQDLRPARKETWRKPKISSEEVAKQMFILAEARQATLPKKLEIYQNGLDGFFLEDLKAAVSVLCLSERGEGRTALPSLGEMVSACQAAARRRYEAEKLARDAEDSEYVRTHPDRFFTRGELVTDIEMMRDAVAVAFGPDWRTHPLMLERVGHGDDPTKHRFGLADMYDIAMRP